MNNDDWLSSDMWDASWQGEPVVTLEQLLALARSQFSGTDREVLLAFSALPVFAKAPDRLARQVLNKIGRRVTYTNDGTRRIVRRTPHTKRSRGRVYGGPKSVFSHDSSWIPVGTVGIGMASFYSTDRSRAKVEWLDREDVHKGHILSRTIDQLDSEFPGLLEEADVRSVLFTTEEGAPPYMGGAFLPGVRQIRILRTMKTKNRVGKLVSTPRSQGQMYYTLLHGIGHALGDGFTLSRLYGDSVKLSPPDWVRTLEPDQRKRWVHGVTRYKTVTVDGGENPFGELFADAFTDFLVAGTTNSDELDGWIKAVLEAKGVLGKIGGMRSKRTPTGFAGRTANLADIEEFLISENQKAGEGLSPDELNHVVAVYSIPGR